VRNKLATAYVLINCDLGSEESVISELKSIEGVAEVHGIFGAYDILAKVESKQVETLRETITWKIRKIPKIRSTLTLMGIEGQE
jgi:DNA-binding Lrp family transcriptional regulator